MASLAQPAQSNTSVLTSVSATFTNNPTQGNLLIAAVTANVATGSIALTNSGWSSGTTITVGAAGGLNVFYKVAVAGSDKTVTATGTLATFMDIQIFEYDGIDNASPLDQTASTADSGSGVTSRASGTTATLTQAIELSFVAVAMDGANGGGASWTNSYTAELTTSHLITADLTTAATTATSSTGSWTNSVRAAGVILTFFGETGGSEVSVTSNIIKGGIKPRTPSINWNNPITKGLVFDFPFFKRGGGIVTDIASKVIGTIANSQTWLYDRNGPVLKFPNSNSSLTFTSTANQAVGNLFSIELLVFKNGDGGGGFGTLFRKNSSSGFISFIQNDGGSSCLTLDVGFSTTTGKFITATSTFASGNYYHIVLTYDSTSTSNVPTMYINGVSVAVAVSVAPVGSRVAEGTDCYIGNNSTLIRQFDGWFFYERMWKRLLSTQEAKQLYSNPWQIYTQPGLLTRKY